MASVGWFESALDCFSYRPTISYQIIAYPFVEDYFNIAGPFRPGLSGNLPSPFELNTDSSQEVPGSEASRLSLA